MEIDLTLVNKTLKDMRNIWLCQDEFQLSGLCATVHFMYNNDMITLKEASHTKHYILSNPPKSHTLYKLFNPKSLYYWRPNSRYPRLKYINSHVGVLDNKLS